MMQGQILYPVNPIILMPLVTTTVRTGCKEPMQHGQENGSLHIKLKLPFLQKPSDDLSDPQLFPESLEDQRGTHLFRRGMNFTLAGQNQKHLLGEPREGSDELFNIPLGL